MLGEERAERMCGDLVAEIWRGMEVAMGEVIAGETPIGIAGEVAGAGGVGGGIEMVGEMVGGTV